MKKIISCITILLCCVQLCAAVYAEISFPGAPIEVQKMWELSKQYPYYTDPEEDERERCSVLHDDDGLTYLMSGFYFDSMATMLNSVLDLQKSELNVYVNGIKSTYSGECVIHNIDPEEPDRAVTLVPKDVFNELGVTVESVDELCMTRLQKDGNILEIIPTALAMRKNQTAGKWIGLPACARYIDGKLYLPVRKVAEELGIQVDWDGDTRSVYLITV